MITVHGPGYVIVTDTTPNDGALDDDINTIQLVNTSPKKTYVTGNVIPSNTVQTTGEILFNQLVAVSGVKSIELNGFDLSAAVTPAVTTPTGVFLYGGVGTLSFNSINAQIDTSVNPAPYPIVIGHAEHAAQAAAVDLLEQHHQPGLRQHVDDHSDHAADDAFGAISRSTASCATSTSSRRRRVRFRPAFQFEFPQVGTTGRTAVQATAINTLNVHGSAKNFTVSRAPVPFSSEASGVGYLQEGPLRRQRRRGGPGRARQDRQAHLQAGAGKSRRRLHGQVVLVRPVAAVDDSTERLRARPGILPPGSRAARSGPRASASSTSGRPTCWSRRRRIRISSSSASKDIRPTRSPRAIRSRTP